MTAVQAAHGSTSHPDFTQRTCDTTSFVLSLSSMPPRFHGLCSPIDSSRLTPFCHFARRMGRRLRTATGLLDVHLVAALVQAGAEATAADAYGRTPLHALAAAASTDAAVEKAGPILRILLARGAKVRAVLKRVQADELTVQQYGVVAAKHTDWRNLFVAGPT